MIGKNEKRFYWFCLALAIYIVIGFKAVPAILQDQLVKNLDNTLTLKTNIKKVEFNPFTFNTKIHGFTLGDTKKPTVSFEEFELDFGLVESIFQLHVNIENVRLKNAFVDVIQAKDDSINLANLVKPTNKPKKEEKSSEPSNIKFLVSQIHLENANVEFTKQKEKDDYKLSLKNINYDLYEVGTYKNSLASNSFTLDINDSTKLGIHGAFNLMPFKMYGVTTIENLKLEELANYKKEILNFQLDKKARFDLNLNYDIDTTDKLQVLLDSTLLKLSNINLAQGKSQPIKLDSLNVGLFKLDLANQKVVLDDIGLKNPYLNVIKSKESINLAKLIKTSNKPSVEEKKEEDIKATSSKPWGVSVNNLHLDNTFLLFNDTVANTTIKNPNFNINLANLNMIGSTINLSNLSVRNPNLTVTDNKNKVNITTKNLNLGISKLKLQDNIIDIDKINVKEQRVSVKDRKNALSVITNKTDIEVSNVNLNNGITTIANIKTKLPVLYINNAKTKMNINVLGSTINTKDIKIDGAKTNISSISLYNPNLNIKDKINKTDINIKKTNVNLDSLALNGSNVNINKIIVSKPTIKLSNKKNNNQITARNIKVTLNKFVQNSNGIKLSSVRLYEPALNIYNTKEKTKIDVKNLNLFVKSIQNNKRGLKIAKVDVNKPRVQIVLPKKPEAKAKKEEPKKTKPKKAGDDPKLNIGPVNIKNAVLTFEDKNLPLPFKTTITKLNGKVSELNTKTASKTRLKVDGVVDKYGVAKITGIVDPSDVKLLTDITMLFKNISMQNFTPYTEKFVGRELNSGKLNLDLKYNIKKSDLNANNNIIITKIKFGKEVESKDAVSLPLELAIALLEDPNGVIDLNIPISGNVDDPKFSVGPIVWKAFSNLIMKAITAPFSLLGAIFGFSEDEIKSVSFDHAHSEITPTQKETLDKISKILVKRPNLALKLNPTYVEGKDLEAMKKSKFDKYIKTKIPNDQIRNYENKYLSVLESKYKKLDKNFTKTKKSFIKDKKFDKVAFTKFLEDKLISNEKVSKKDVEMLANSRVKNIKTYLVKEKLIKAKQVQLSNDFKINQAHNKTSVIQLEISKSK